jgi:septal ring factor EnvC (AmiA/AmiB activator)
MKFGFDVNNVNGFLAAFTGAVSAIAGWVGASYRERRSRKKNEIEMMSSRLDVYNEIVDNLSKQITDLIKENAKLIKDNEQLHLENQKLSERIMILDEKLRKISVRYPNFRID